MSTATLDLPTKVVDSDWKDDIDYEPYLDEKTYISPKDVKKTTIDKIKKSSIKLSAKGLWSWKNIDEQLSA